MLATEHSLLGQQSRARRVRSAHMRNTRKGSTASLADIRKLYPTHYPDLETSSNASSLEMNANINPALFTPPMYQQNALSEHNSLFQKHNRRKRRPKTAKANRYEFLLAR